MLTQEIDDLGSLVDPRLVEMAKRFISQYADRMPGAPHVVPMTRGRLQFEWHRQGRSLEIEFEDPREVHYLRWDIGQGIADEAIIPVSDHITITRLFEWFGG